MLNRIFIHSAILLSIFLISCDGYKKTDGGLKYKIIVDSSGKNAEVGGVVLVHMIYKNEKDTFNSFKLNQGQPIDILIPASSFKGSLEEGLTELSQGDSATFMVSSDSLYTNKFKTPLPKEIKVGGITTFEVRVVKVYTKSEVAEERAKYDLQQKERLNQQMEMVAQYKKAMLDSAHVKIQLKKDDKILSSFIKKEKMDTKKTENGIYYVVTNDSPASPAKNGDTVIVNYTGKLLDGSVFDSSEGKQAFSLILGAGQVIPGWDEALLNFGKGDKATILIPSSLAYGARSIKDPSNPAKFLIPSNSPLLFDIEIMDVK